MCWDTLTLGAYSIFDTLLKEARHFYLADLKFYLISSFPHLTSMKRPKNRGQNRPFFARFFPRFFAKNHYILWLNPSISLPNHNSASLLTLYIFHNVIYRYKTVVISCISFTIRHNTTPYHSNHLMLFV